MDKATVIALADKTGLFDYLDLDGDSVGQLILQNFAALVAAHERNKIAAWMIDRGYATWHGDTTEDLLNELEWQIKEREREECAKVCEDYDTGQDLPFDRAVIECAAAIRSRT